MDEQSQAIYEMQQQLVNIATTVGQIQATLVENAKHDEQTRFEFRHELTELWGAFRLMKDDTASKKEVDSAFDKIRLLEDAPKDAALERQRTIIKWVLTPIGIVVGGWVLYMLTKIGLAPPK